METYNELIERYEKKKESLELDSQHVNVADLYFMQQALMCREFTSEFFNYELDGSIDSLEGLDEILRLMKDSATKAEITDYMIDLFLRGISGYFGLMLLDELHGVAMMISEDEAIIDFGGNEVKPYQEVLNSYQNHNQQLSDLYNFIKNH